MPGPTVGSMHASLPVYVVLLEERTEARSCVVRPRVERDGQYCRAGDAAQGVVVRAVVWAAMRAALAATFVSG